MKKPNQDNTAPGQTSQPKPKTAPEILTAGAQHMADRAALRDSPEGERSMARAVKAFNALENTNLTETQGWRFMAVLKHARSAQGQLSLDDYEDAAAYWALAGESAQSEQNIAPSSGQRCEPTLPSVKEVSEGLKVLANVGQPAYVTVSPVWIPHIGDIYYYLSNTGVVDSRVWKGTPQEQKRLDAGHVFKSLKGAQESAHTQGYIFHENDPVRYPEVGDEVYVIGWTENEERWAVFDEGNSTQDPDVVSSDMLQPLNTGGRRVTLNAAMKWHKEGRLLHSKEQAEAKAKWWNLNGITPDDRVGE